MSQPAPSPRPAASAAAIPLGQSSAAQTTSARTLESESATERSGVHGAAHMARPFTGPGKIRSPSPGPRFIPQTKQSGNTGSAKYLAPRAAASASASDTVAGISSGPAWRRGGLADQRPAVPDPDRAVAVAFDLHRGVQRGRPAQRDRGRAVDVRGDAAADVAAVADARRAVEAGRDGQHVHRGRPGRSKSGSGMPSTLGSPGLGRQSAELRTDRALAARPRRIPRAPRGNYLGAQEYSWCRVTQAAICAREFTWSLRLMFSTCVSAVRGAIDRRLAMAWLVSPSATSSATWSSR